MTRITSKLADNYSYLQLVAVKLVKVSDLQCLELWATDA